MSAGDRQTDKAILRSIGLMSGTSMDGVDIALIDTDGANAITFGPHGFLPYGDADRDLLRRAIADAVALTDRTARPGVLAEAEVMITARHAEAVEVFLARHRIASSSVDLVGFHGQTVLHRPRDRLTVQIGDGPELASRLGIAVAFDFRAADVDAGGQGAPLVPIYHHALVERTTLDGPIAVINIGGVGNISFVARGKEPIGCDTGPGNALLDDLILARMGDACDRDGLVSARGRVNEAALATLLAHPFFAMPPPKSLDRNAFSLEPIAHLDTADAAATLAAFTAASIAMALSSMPATARQAVVCGGGGHNPTIMRELAAWLPCPIVEAETLGWSIDAMEAQAFAYLAVRRAKNLPITFPGTTGIANASTGGRISRSRTVSQERTRVRLADGSPAPRAQ